jgi:hypothetical protein
VEFGIFILMDYVCSDGICLLVCPFARNPLCYIEHCLMGWKELKNGFLRVEHHFISPKQSQY